MNPADLSGMIDFAGRTVVITGGTGVLGSVMARALVGCGASVALLSRNRDKGQALASSLTGAGRAVAVACDVLRREEIERSAEIIDSELGPVDALINAAGGNHPEATTRADLSFFDLPEEALRSAFDLNLLGTILSCQTFARRMAHRGEGVILNVSSMAAVRPLTNVAGYAAAKAGVDNFTQWLAVHMAQEYSPRIRVNAIAPGFFRTEQNRFLLTDKESGELTARGRSILQHTPMGRFGEPEDLVGAVLWLLSPAASFVTGIVLPIDGGFSAFSGV
jgi:NAD(P)-dependent dehydrogenase (short-subunit alcohol dehydrogenase family)